MADARHESLDLIAAQVRTCTLCDLHRTRKKAVPGAGDYASEILFIGEGPGYNEDVQGVPFVGRSGDYLEKLLAVIGLNREQVFIANVVKCRPPENRDPLPVEITTCKPYLDQQEALIDPLVIVTLGRYSMARYFPGGKITQIHGQPKFDSRRAYLPLFHPAAVLRNPTLEGPMEADFRRIPGLVEEMRARRAQAASAPVDSSPAAPGNQEPPTQQLSLF
jgi:DNA polymerase